jgi:hypothetical protein
MLHASTLGCDQSHLSKPLIAALAPCASNGAIVPPEGQVVTRRATWHTQYRNVTTTSHPNTTRLMWKYGVLAALIATAAFTRPVPVFARTLLSSPTAGSLPPFQAFGKRQPADIGKTARAHDGSHDFDFNVGIWKTHIHVLQHPLSGSTTWTRMEGTVKINKVWGGQGLVEQLTADGSSGHLEGLTLYLYNPQSKQWSQIFADKTRGILEAPMIGEFKNGRGELYGSDTFNGRSILVRGTWSAITPNSHKFEIAYSIDGGRTWETNFIGTLERKPS